MKSFLRVVSIQKKSKRNRNTSGEGGMLVAHTIIQDMIAMNTIMVENVMLCIGIWDGGHGDHGGGNCGGDTGGAGDTGGGGDGGGGYGGAGGSD